MLYYHIYFIDEIQHPIYHQQNAGLKASHEPIRKLFAQWNYIQESSSTSKNKNVRYVLENWQDVLTGYQSLEIDQLRPSHQAYYWWRMAKLKVIAADVYSNKIDSYSKAGVALEDAKEAITKPGVKFSANDQLF